MGAAVSVLLREFAEGRGDMNRGERLSRVCTLPVIFSLMLTMNWGLRELWWEIRFGAENTNKSRNVWLNLERDGKARELLPYQNTGRPGETISLDVDNRKSKLTGRLAGSRDLSHRWKPSPVVKWEVRDSRTRPPRKDAPPEEKLSPLLCQEEEHSC